MVFSPSTIEALIRIIGLIKILSTQRREEPKPLPRILLRFDAVYVGHFKCNQARIADYPHLQGYLKELYQISGIAQTVSIEHIKRHYYFSHTMINPTQVVPAGPKLDFDSPHGRERIG